MRNFILLAVFLVTVSVSAFAGTQVPQTVATGLLQTYPLATNVEWTKETGNVYTASFVLDDQKFTANFSETGSWIATTIPMDYNKLPPTVRKSFEAKEGQLVGVMVSRIEVPSGDVKYDLNYRKAGRKTEVIYNLDGAEVK